MARETLYSQDGVAFAAIVPTRALATLRPQQVRLRSMRGRGASTSLTVGVAAVCVRLVMAFFSRVFVVVSGRPREPLLPRKL